eukprot:TRINITY_DN50579_c0_g1_i1.p1 TRINITY_DN50579_c0_g1~~TRINITY_DN50579_c0_g1_i1.p1  ORF type:complete len:254 (-),score=30.75 TRINITY_DN50579_c0_g1_i1:46-759(-)
MSEFKGRTDLQTWMDKLPRQIQFSVDGRRLAVVHGSPLDIADFVWPSACDEDLDARIDLLPSGVDGVVCGHSGLPFARLVPPMDEDEISDMKCRLWLNAGVIGMPANDGTQRGWYAVISVSDVSHGLDIQIRPFDFDAKGAADAILARPNLVRGYADALLSGVWPSHDILPLQEQMASGIALSGQSFFWPSRSLKRDCSRRKKAEPILVVPMVAIASVVCVAALLVAVWRSRGARRS